jgi:hypothetical protein
MISIIGVKPFVKPLYYIADWSRTNMSQSESREHEIICTYNRFFGSFNDSLKTVLLTFYNHFY